MDNSKPRSTPEDASKKALIKKGLAKPAQELAEESKKKALITNAVHGAEIAAVENEAEQLTPLPNESTEAYSARQKAQNKSSLIGRTAKKAGDSAEKMDKWHKKNISDKKLSPRNENTAPQKNAANYQKQRIPSNTVLNSAPKKDTNYQKNSEYGPLNESILARRKAIQAEIIKNRQKNFAKRLGTIKKLNDKIKAKIIEEKAKEFLLQLARRTAMFALRIALSVIATFGETLAILFAIILFSIIIYVAIDNACNINSITGTLCSIIGKII